MFEAYRSLAQVLYDNARKYGDRTAYRTYRSGRWVPVSWTALMGHVERVASALLQNGVAEGENVALFAPNCPEWTWVDFGCTAIRAVSVPIHATCTSRVVRQILGETCPRIAFVGTRDQLAVLREADEGDVGLIVLLQGEPESGDDPRCVSLAGFLGSLEVEAFQAEIRARLDRARRDDLWTIVYTSGTTGDVRGAMLTQGNVLYQADAHRTRLPDLTDGDSSFCLLPLSHIFERGWTSIQYAFGMTHHYCEVTPQALALLPTARPSVLCLVPRVLEKVYAAVRDSFAARPAPLRALLEGALRVARRTQALRSRGEAVPALLRVQQALADALVLKKIRGIFGGRLKHCVVGGAALSTEVHEFFLSAGVFINTGYGLSETTATVTSTPMGASVPGAVGIPLQGQEVRLGPDREIQVRGPNVMAGYYRKEEATREVFTEDGFFRTGDVGEVDASGILRITDRLKELIKTSTGKYVAPQYLEARLASCPLVDQVAVIGEGRSSLGALLVPDFARLEALARQLGLPALPREDLVERPEILASVKKVLDEALADVSRHERIQRIALLARPFTVQEGELTPTLKLRRKVILEKYRSVIERMDEVWSGAFGAGPDGATT